MASDIPERIAVLVGSAKKKDFAENAGITPTQLSDILSRNTGIGLQILTKIAQATGTSMEWLVHGRGPQRVEDLVAPIRVTELGPGTAEALPDSLLFEEVSRRVQAARTREERGVVIEPKIALVSKKDLDAALQSTEGSRWREAFEAVPILEDAAAAGPPRGIDDDRIQGFALIYRRWVRPGGVYSCVKVAGDSMDPLIRDGAILGVNHAARDPRELSGSVVAARIDDGVTVKWLTFDDRYYILTPENRSHRPIYVSLDTPDLVIGRIEWGWQTF